MSQQFPSFEIPDFAPDPVAKASAAERKSLTLASLEFQAYSSGNLTPRQVTLDWRLRFILRTVFFFFALIINLWWDNNVRQMIWQSGRVGTGFHLSDGVLVALLTTSVANFLALLTIIATHLFQKPPEKHADSEISPRFPPSR